MKPNRQKRRAAAMLRLMAFKLGKWQVDQCGHVSRKDNNKLFEAEMHMKQTSRRVLKGYE